MNYVLFTLLLLNRPFFNMQFSLVELQLKLDGHLVKHRPPIRPNQT